jgi:hypothetical protein
MKHYPTPNTELECKRLSHEEAISRGCDETTLYWWSWFEDEGGWYIEIEQLTNQVDEELELP